MTIPNSIRRAAILVALALAGLSPLAAADDTPLASRPTLTLEGARAALAAATAEALRSGGTGAIAVVDDGGALLASVRLDGTFPAAATVANGKARTAAIFRKPTKAFEDSIAKGRVALTAVAEMTPLQGGVPIEIDGQVVGAVGVSGAASADRDTEIATAGAAALASARPIASLDLMTADGLAAVGGSWRAHDATLSPVDFFAAGADGQPGSSASRSLEVTPAAGRAGFDDSGWEVVAPAELARRRGPGRVSFEWYRLKLTVPESIGGRALAGSDAILSVSLDDAAEIWVDGELERCAGQVGGSVATGWNATNRLTVGRRLKPGGTIEVAVFGINGPLSVGPTNYVYFHSARLDFVPGTNAPRSIAPACEVNVEVERRAPGLDAVLSRNPKLFKVGEGFAFTEGPLWVPDGEGYLLFSDPNENKIWKRGAKGELSVYRTPSGYEGADIARYRQPGSNGLALDPQGRLVADQHGNRRVVRFEPDGRTTVLADRYQGKRLNSPNDLVYGPDGSLYFTDPFFGLPGFEKDPGKELPWSGVFRRTPHGELELVDKSLSGPNGIALSPDGRTLYVGDWDEARKVVMRYPIAADGRVGAGAVLVDLTREPGDDAIDGLKVDLDGRIYVAGPGGLWIVAPDGTVLGLVRAPRGVHNLAWGEDGRALYLAAQDALYRLPVLARGYAPHLARPVAIAPANP